MFFQDHVLFLSVARRNPHTCLWCTHLPVVCTHLPAVHTTHTCLQCTHLPVVHHTPARSAHSCPWCTHLPEVHTPVRGAHSSLQHAHLPAPACGARTCLWCICALGHCVKHKAVLRLRVSGCVWKYIAMVEGCSRSPSGVHPHVRSTLSLVGLKTAGYARPSGW